jgi:hypothetical protein
MMMSGGSGSNGIGGPGNNKYREIQGEVPKGKDGKITKVTGDVGPEGMVFSGGDTKGAPDQPGASSVPYYEVSSNYKKAAEKALSKEDVPPAYRKPVKDYFESLK